MQFFYAKKWEEIGVVFDFVALGVGLDGWEVDWIICDVKWRWNEICLGLFSVGLLCAKVF